MSEFKQYRRSQVAELRPYVLGESLDGVSISSVDREAGSPLPGDMIARNPKNHADQWLVAAKYFADNFEPLDEGQRAGEEWRQDREAIKFLADRVGLWANLANLPPDVLAAVERARQP